MIGNGYWSTGISVAWLPGDGGRPGSWAARAPFYDDGWIGDDSPDDGLVVTEGEVRSRYGVRDGLRAGGLTAVIDAVKADTERLGIHWRGPGGRGPAIYYEHDGQGPDGPPPAGWRQLLTAQSDRLGWEAPYRDSPMEATP